MNFIELERRRLRAIVDADHDVLEELHHPEFVLCNPRGEVWDRRTYLEGLRGGHVKYTRFEALGDIDVQTSDSITVLRYRSAIEVMTPAGPGNLQCWHLDVYVLDENGAWRCKWSQATEISSQ